ncbi:MAG: serine/threonine-protein kinase [Gemmatimonadota bacterium]
MSAIVERLTAALSRSYRIERELGAGGMATVYLAEDLKHHRMVAIKVLRQELAAALGSDRFLREIETTANLRHPHILPLYDSGEAGKPGGEGGSLLYYVMPYVEGESLRDRLDREKQLPLDDAIQIAREVADALGYAHSRGVIHRDIKPENILLESGHAVVADFGIARAVSAAGGERITQTGMAIGTPAYMSPEQSSAETVDGRSDLYALGCVLYEMLAGEPPYTGPTAGAIMAKRLMEPVPRISVVRETVSPGLERVISRALARVPADRYPTAAGFAAALASPGPPRISSSPIRHRYRKWPMLAAAAAVLCVAGTWFLRRPSGPPSAASVIAVLPLAPASADPELSRLGRDLVVTLSANLEGVAEIHSVDAQTILAQSSQPDKIYSLEEGRALGRRFGAGSIVHGSLVRIGSNVRLDVGLFSTDTTDRGSLAQVTVTASPDSVGTLTDSVAHQLLRSIWRRGDPPSPSLEGALRTRSVAGLRAFLEGERAFVDGQWEDAIRAYAQAIGADSSFWLAYQRYSVAYAWGRNLAPDTTILKPLLSHRQDLPELERMLLGTAPEYDDNISSILTRARMVTERFPDNWLGWFEYGDHLVHEGPLLGYPRADARAALERAVALNPRLINMWLHLMWMTVPDADPAAFRRVYEGLEQLKPGPALGYQGQDDMLQYRLIGRILNEDSAGTSLLVDSVARSNAANPPNQVGSDASPFNFAFCGAQIAVSRETLRLGVSPTAADAHRHLIMWCWAVRGAWDSALVAVDQYATMSTSPIAQLQRYRSVVLGVWLGALPPKDATNRRKSAVQAVERLEPEARTDLAWVDGILAASQGDRAALKVSQKALRQMGDDDAAVLEQSLSAFDLALGGNRPGAAAILVELERTLAEQSMHDGTVLRHPLLAAVDRLAIAEWSLGVEVPADAARLLTWEDGPASQSLPREAMMVAPLAFYQLARIEEARGNNQLAQEDYRQFLRRYDLPAPALRHLVTEARAAVARLSGLNEPGAQQ